MTSKAGKIEEISGRLCKEFQSAMPAPPDAKGRGKKISDQEIKARTEAGLKRFYQSAEEERSRHQLGIIGRARVAFALQKKLLEAGYPAPLVKQVLMALLASVFVGGRSK